MRNRVWIALALASALGLAGCGGGGNPSPPSLASVASVNAASTAPTSPPSGGFKAVVSFGDSLSDVGTYGPAVQAYAAMNASGTPLYPLYQYLVGSNQSSLANSLIAQGVAAAQGVGFDPALGGQFTVNGSTTANWVVDLSSTLLGLPAQQAITPNIIGYAGKSATCPLKINCFGFAQGGSMVSNPIGIGHSGGALTLPVTTQVQNYLAQFNGSFNSNQLVTVLAGNNDIFTALGTVSATVTQAVTQAVTSALQQNPSLTPAQIAQIQAEAQQSATTSAVSAAQTNVAIAADELAAQIKLITSKGAKYVMVYTLPDSSQTPFGRGLPYTGMTPPQAPPAGYVCDNTVTTTPCYLLSNLVQVFNQRLLNDLQGQPVKVLDGYSLLNQEVTNPAQFGFTNVTTPWCNPATTSSLLCNVNTPYAAAGASAANLGTWLFADTVHPTPAGYKIIASTTLQAMKGFGWISQ